MLLAHAFAALLIGFTPPAEIPKAALTQFDNVAHQLAKGGRERECKELFEILDQLGMQKPQLGKLKAACTSELEKARRVVDALPDASKRLQQVARQLATGIDKLPAEEQQRLARLLVRLDDSVEEAHTLLGDVKAGSEWVSPEESKTRKRRGEILEAVRKAGDLEPVVESGPSDDELLVKLNGAPGSFARYGGWTLQSCLSEERTKRVLVEVLRAEALSLWLRDKPLAPPRKPAAMNGIAFYLVDQLGKYRTAIELAQAADEITPQQAEQYRELGGFTDNRQRIYVQGAFESGLESTIFCDISSSLRGPHTASVRAGHLNWVSLALLGVSMPQFAWKNKETGELRVETHVDNPADRALRAEKLELAKAGILGCRSWVAFLAARNEDPRWENSFVDEIGKVTGEDLLKATTVVEYMQELGVFHGVFLKLFGGQDGEKTYAVMNKALGMPVTEFEAHWREWIVQRDGGLAQVIDKQTDKGFSPDAQAALAHLNEIRKHTFAGRVKDVAELKLEREICEGAQKHAEYLAQNPEQADKWPDAHEEYRDKPGYTPEGHWAGNHANVMSGDADPESAVDGWIGTFYHRLPMITPELRRVAWGSAGKMAVLDVSSFVTPPESDWMVVFPYDGMSNVPPHFLGHEHPNPVPEEEDQDFGYPVTLQLGLTSRDEPAPEITLHLFEGKTEVPCWFSSPSKPTNPKLVPQNTWCLIPKGSLKSNTGYTVSAEWYQSGRKFEWSFRTGG
ncbi:MAG: hypothetical protein IPJ19_07610 [Planctomycetes bacterium]|nr:hypothetical protein [Planctomycetota bacterium]